MDWMTDWIFNLLFSFQKVICYIIDFIKEIFYALAGIETVNMNGQETDILSSFLNSRAVKVGFWSIFLIACILLIVFVIIAIIRSEYAEGQNKRSKGKILGKALQSFLIFLMIPFILMAGVMFTNTVMGSVNDAMNPYVMEQGEQATIGGQILVTSGYHAYIGDPDLRDDVEYNFITGKLDYFDEDVVSVYYDIRDIDFFTGIIGSLTILVMFVISSITLIQRLFDIVLLYLISPISVSTIPADDGNRFKLWKEMMISKVLSAYGIILSMNLFFIIIPQVQTISFFANDFKNGIMKILFLIGGAFAVTKANLVVAQLTGNTAGGQETQQLIANMRTGKSIARAIGTTGVSLGGAVVGGKNFFTGRNNSGTMGGGFTNSFKGQVSNPIVSKADQTNKVKRMATMPTRIATMPLGVIKDIAQGGIVGAGRNIGPRFRNIVHGDSVLNHAEIKPKTPTNPEEKTE